MSAQTDGAPVGAIHVPLGELLLQRGLITAEQLQAALAEQGRSRRPLGEILIALGFVPAAIIAQALATQHGSLLKTEYGYATGFGPEAPAGVTGIPPVTAEPVQEFVPLAAPPPPPPPPPPAEPAPPLVPVEPPPAAPDPSAARAAELEGERDRLEAAVAERDATIERLRSAAEALAERTDRLETLEAELAAARAERPEASISVDAAAFTSRIAELEDALVAEVAGRNQLEAAVGERDTRIRELEELVREQPWASSERHLLFFSGADGYALVELDGPPPLPGARVEAPGAAGPQIVTRVAPAPLPGQALPCAYLVAA